MNIANYFCLELFPGLKNVLYRFLRFKADFNAIGISKEVRPFLA